MCVSAEIGHLMNMTTFATVKRHYDLLGVLSFQDVIQTAVGAGAMWKQIHHDMLFRGGCAYMSILREVGNFALNSEGDYLFALGEDIIERAVALTRERARHIYTP